MALGSLGAATGVFDDPAAGYRASRPGIGARLWVIRQLVWDISFFHGQAAFTARLVL